MIVLDQTLAASLGVVALLLGRFVNGKVGFLSRICIPDPVTGGLIVSLLTFALKSFAGVEIAFDRSIQDICMLIFFTTVGFQCNLSAIRKGGKPLVVMIVLVGVLVCLQNLLSVGIASSMGLEPVFGMVAGSIPMCGGHGTAAGFSQLLESRGVENAVSITMATATFGLIAGALVGGPVAKLLITRRHLTVTPEGDADSESALKFFKEEDDGYGQAGRVTMAAFEIFIAMGLGSLASKLLSLTGLAFPSYFGALVCAIAIRNVADAVHGGVRVHPREISRIGALCLALFLGMAMCSLRLWELAGLALPLCLMLLAQVAMMVVFSIFVAFPLLGRNYTAAVLVSGFCGFGLGATPNAMANMSAVCNKFGYVNLPFIVVPVIGAAFVDIINITVISLFVNFL